MEIQQTLLNVQENEKRLRVDFAKTPIESDDPFFYHKTTLRSEYEKHLSEVPGGVNDVILFNEKGEVTESTIANIAVYIGNLLVYPSTSVRSFSRDKTGGITPA